MSNDSNTDSFPVRNQSWRNQRKPWWCRHHLVPCCVSSSCSGKDGFCHPLYSLQWCLRACLLASVTFLKAGAFQSSGISWACTVTCSKIRILMVVDDFLWTCINYYNTYLGTRLWYFKNHLGFIYKLPMRIQKNDVKFFSLWRLFSPWIWSYGGLQKSKWVLWLWEGRRGHH